jgi:ATP-binding cassette subfamily B protein
MAALRRFLPYMRPQAHLIVLTIAAAVVVLAAATSIPLVIKAVVDGPIAHGRPGGLWPYAVLLVLLSALEVTGNFIRRNYSVLASLRMEYSMRNDFYAHLQALQVAFHDNWQSGQLLSRAIADVQSVRRFVGFGLVFAAYFVVLWMAVLGVLLWLDWKLALVTTVVALPIYVVSRRFFDGYRVTARRVQDQQGDLTTVIEEMATGVRIIKAFGRSLVLRERFEREASKLRDTNLVGVKQRAEVSSLFGFFSNLNLAAVVLVGGVQVAYGDLTIGGLIAFTTYLFMLVWPLDALGWVLSMGEEAATAAQRLLEVLDSEPAIVERPQARTLAGVRGAVSFRSAGFRYSPAGGWVLRGLELEIRPGETMAIAGATGAGKSTLAALVPRLYDVSEGAVLLDGEDVRDLELRSLRQHVGVAFEDPILFSASVHENLVMGRPLVSDQQLKRAIQVAKADFVWDLPWGLETRVGEQGHSLSGGQRQRLALARAVLGSPRVLVLDDPLSAVDVHTEREIEDALRSMLAGVTALLIVHRPSTLALADRVALLGEGRVVAVGTHSELMRSQPTYRSLLAEAAEVA